MFFYTAIYQSSEQASDTSANVEAALILDGDV